MEEGEISSIRIVLKSQEIKNLEFVTGKIISLAKERNFEVRGPRFMPNKILRITTRQSPCGEGTNTYDEFEMRIHTRIVDIRCPPKSVSEITEPAGLFGELIIISRVFEFKTEYTLSQSIL